MRVQLLMKMDAFRCMTVLFLVCVFRISQCQVQPFYSTCQEVSAAGTIRVSILEADAQFLIDAARSNYRAGLRLAADISSTGLQFDVNYIFAIPPNEYFDLENGPRSDGISGREWYLQLKKPIDRDGLRPDSLDDQNLFEFTLQCTDLTMNTAFFPLLRVGITDVNDNSPVFVNVPYSISVNELTPIGSTIFQGITATDLDYGINKNIVFDILPGVAGLNDGSSKFAINLPSQGFVTVEEYLDFESLYAGGNTNYVLQIRARDTTSIPRSTITTLNISIIDGDDLRPVFEYPSCVLDAYGKCFTPSYKASIIPDRQTDLTVFPLPSNNPSTPIRIRARDQDTLNNEIVYTVEMTDPVGFENYFRVTTSNDPGTSGYAAQVSVVQPIPRAAVNEIKIIIRAAEVSFNRRYERAVIYATIVNSTYVETTTVTKPTTVTMPTGSVDTGSGVNIPAIVLGCVVIVLLIVVVLMAAYIILRLQKQKQQDLYTHLSVDRAQSTTYDVIKDAKSQALKDESEIANGGASNAETTLNQFDRQLSSSVQYQVPRTEDGEYLEII